MGLVKMGAAGELILVEQAVFHLFFSSTAASSASPCSLPFAAAAACIRITSGRQPQLERLALLAASARPGNVGHGE